MPAAVAPGFEIVDLSAWVRPQPVVDVVEVVEPLPPSVESQNILAIEREVSAPAPVVDSETPPETESESETESETESKPEPEPATDPEPIFELPSGNDKVAHVPKELIEEPVMMEPLTITDHSADGRPFSHSDDLTPPRSDVAYLNNHQPEYPRSARRRRLEGMVLLEVKVDVAGDPVFVAVKQSSGHYVLDDAARWAVERWRFVPAQRDGDAVAAVVEVPIRFQLY